MSAASPSRRVTLPDPASSGPAPPRAHLGGATSLTEEQVYLHRREHGWSVLPRQNALLLWRHLASQLVHFFAALGSTGRRITPADVRWASGLRGHLTDGQWADAFRAGGYPPRVANQFIATIQRKITEGRLLGSRSPTP